MSLRSVGFSLHLLVALGACSTTDDRPQTLAYITETILVPKCAQAECHSSARKQSGYVFDTVEHAQQSMAGDSTTASVGELVVPGVRTSSQLLIVIGGVEDADGNRLADLFGRRMPLDEPLPNIDVYFIGNWIENGAAGFVPPPTP